MGNTGNDDKVYVGFRVPIMPYKLAGYNKPKDPMVKWLEENLQNPRTLEYGYTGGMRTGIFLSPEDAIAFKLKFGI